MMIYRLQLLCRLNHVCKKLLLSDWGGHDLTPLTKLGELRSNFIHLSGLNDTLGYLHTVWGKFHSSEVKKDSKTRLRAYSSRYIAIF